MNSGNKYHTGMYGGSFNPLHLGHLECMIKAAGLCDELFVVISYREDDKGLPVQDIPVRIKIRWVYQLTKHIGNVHILALKDRTLRKEDYSEDLWEEECRIVKGQIGRPSDVVFCGSDYDENSFWNKCRFSPGSVQLNGHPKRYLWTLGLDAADRPVILYEESSSDRR